MVDPIMKLKLEVVPYNFSVYSLELSQISVIRSVIQLDTRNFEQ